jgi:flagellar hook protein FlgE
MSVFYQPNAAATTSFPYSQPALTSATLEFDNFGKLIGPATVAIDLSSLNGEAIEMDISGMTQLAADFTQGDVGKNGAGPSAVEDVVIGVDGILYTRDSKGNTTPLYRLPVANVQSPDQLRVMPGNVFAVGPESGDVQIGFAGSGGLGDIISGSIENSNVDIAEELTSMIESQRNYTANSKVFQTGSDLMDVLVNLKR